jgi:hypothetical protein
MSHVMKKFKLLWKNGFENRVDVEFFIELIHTVCLVLVALFWTRRMQHRRVRYWKKFTSELYFMFCFITVPCLMVKIQIWRHYFLNTLHIMPLVWVTPWTTVTYMLRPNK